jgi:hypothetical protein
MYLVPCIQNLGLHVGPLEAVGLIKFRSHESSKAAQIYH